MTSAELYQWMADTSLLNKSSLQELKQMVEDFPWFHGVRMLYMKNMAVLSDVRLDKELKKMSIHVPDRRKLFMLINDDNFAITVNKKSPEAGLTSTEDVFNVVLAKTVLTPAPTVIAASDYVNWLETNADDLPVTEGEGSRLKHQDLIDSFIENEGKQFARRLDIPLEGENIPDTDNESEKNINSVTKKKSLDDSYFTETLARVYINQKRYDKALEIIRSLSLKYPEKNIYFADQIRYLEKIINIKK